MTGHGVGDEWETWLAPTAPTLQNLIREFVAEAAVWFSAPRRRSVRRTEMERDTVLIRGWVTRLLVALCVCGAGCAVAASNALAVVAGFGTEGEGPGQLAEARGVAGEQESGDVYIADREGARIAKFGPEGEFMLAWGWGVADREERPETCTSVCFAGIEGGGAGQLDDPSGIAVNNDPLSPSHGYVYVADTNNDRVESFEPDGAFVWAIGGEVNKTKDETAGATEAEKNLCTAASGNLCQAGAPPAVPGVHGAFELEGGDVVGVDPEGTVYVGDKERVQEFSEAGVFKAQIELPAGAKATEALAVGAGGEVYVRSEELPGVREYEGCSVTCVGKEVAVVSGPIDHEGEPGPIALGGAGELFVLDRKEPNHVFEYNAAGKQVASFAAGIEATRGLGWGEHIKRLYALSNGHVQLISPPPPGPLVISESAGELTPTAAALEADVNPEGQEESSSEVLRYRFEYGETQVYDKSTGAETTHSGSLEDHHLSVPVTGLRPSTSYHFRVVVTNAANETTDGPDQTFTTQPPALIAGESASQVSATSARLAAEINPLGSSTHYRFEYGRSTAYEEPSVPAGEASAGAGAASVPVSILLEELAPGTTYHYRVLASNALGEAPGPDRTFTTEGAATTPLLDGRAWEMVSPPDKRGASLEMSTEEGGVIQAAEDGDALTYFAMAPIVSKPAGNRSFEYSQLLSKRGPQGWTTEDLTTPQESIEGLNGGSLTEYKLFSDDLSVGLTEPEGATPLSPPRSEAERSHQERTPYLRENGGGEYVPLLTVENVAPGAKFGGQQPVPGGSFVEGATFVSATPDFKHLVLHSPVPLTAGLEASEHGSLYELTGGSLELASVLPDGKAAAEEGGAASLGANDYGVRNALSMNGTRLVFEAELGGTRHLYMRDMALKQTAQLDVPTESAKNPGQGAPVYVDASVDDSKVFFVDGQRLTAHSTASGQEPDLYMCEAAVVAGTLTCALKDLTIPLGLGERADVLGADIGADESGRYIYFVANGVLAPGAVHGNCGSSGTGQLAEASASCDLYVHDTTTGETRLIAVLSNRDAPDWQAAFEQRDKFGELTARVSPDGRYLAFMSQRSLTGYDNRDARTGAPDEEVFLYDVATNTLRCVSCNPTGARPLGVSDPNISQPSSPPALLVDRPDVWGEQSLAGSIPGWPLVDVFHALYEPRNLSDDGRLFFDAADDLVPQDSNGKEDVYEYEPDATGSCNLPNGCVALISSGTSGEESAFMDASREGEDVFFMTSAKLVPQDVDNALDVYDAHVCSPAVPCPGGLVTAPPPCGGTESCRQSSPAQPASSGSPPTATPSGDGNLQPAAPTPNAPKPLTRAQKLARALKACRHRRGTTRKRCEARAKKRYGPLRTNTKRGKR